ncbi:glycylpeptide N-tetradecanoyltransferase 1 [Patella vulgata]|uniref:glycylpeptide N-tetradecanoyltransferase 1 n=1 Tax=Patella vulgata TaxID=6465 RepID=UPI0024A95D36|nr:glycylpeptide N-tetradecanoyltransferase 1 [Patella vulgata]
MADADSLHDMSSDLEQDQSAVDGDVDDDLVNEESADASSRKKSKKKKRKPKDMERSSGDSDSQAVLDEQETKIQMIEGLTELLQSGAEADSESQQHDRQCTADHNHAENDMNDREVSINQLRQMQQKAAGIQSIQRAVELLSMQKESAKTIQDAKKKVFQFWRTQPVPKLDEEVQGNDHIEPDKSVQEIREEPYSLPTGFKWDTLDIQDPIVLKELYTLLNENYVEDDDNMFRFDYSSEFLRWALMPPGWLQSWHCGIRVIKSEKLVGFISAVPAHVKIYDKSKKMVEINFLCVHKKLRSKRMAPVLIKEITRRVHKQGLFQAVYTAGVVLPKPVAVCRYWHRSLNPRKLIDIKFSHLSRNMTMQRTLKLYKLPESPRTEGFRPYKPSDLRQSHKLLSDYLRKFDLLAVYSSI